jgi:hypothetical protein
VSERETANVTCRFAFFDFTRFSRAAPRLHPVSQRSVISLSTPPFTRFAAPCCAARWSPDDQRGRPATSSALSLDAFPVCAVIFVGFAPPSLSGTSLALE